MTDYKTKYDRLGGSNKWEVAVGAVWIVGMVVLAIGLLEGLMLVFPD